MQKVITISSRVNAAKDGAIFKEYEYPELNKYLEDGYSILQTIPILKQADSSYWYALTFILEKKS